MFILLLLVILFKIHSRNKIYGHKFKYYNPYKRKCKKCGRNEVFFETSRTTGTWDEMYPLADNKAALCYVKD